MSSDSRVTEGFEWRRPEGIKGPLVKTAYLTTTMGPSIPLDLASTLTLKVE